MKLKDFENRNLIFESIWKTVALTVISGLFVLFALTTDIQDNKPYIFWGTIGVFGFSLLHGLYKLFNPKNLFLKPNGKLAKEYKKLNFEKRLNDIGIFEFNSDGFIIKIDNQPQEYRWDEILALFGYKMDLYTIDNICLDIFTNDGKYFTINEDTPGWYQFLKQSKMNLKGIPQNWEIEIAVPAFETKLTLLYDAENKNLEEAIDKFYKKE